jgi:hypothetical protein
LNGQRKNHYAEQEQSCNKSIIKHGLEGAADYFKATWLTDNPDGMPARPAKQTWFPGLWIQISAVHLIALWGRAILQALSYCLHRPVRCCPV